VCELVPEDDARATNGGCSEHGVGSGDSMPLGSSGHRGPPRKVLFPNSNGDGSRRGSTSVISGTAGSSDLALGVERWEDRGLVMEAGDRIGDSVATVPDGEPLPLCVGARFGLVASTVGTLDSRDVLGCRPDSAFPPISRVAEYDRRERAAVAY
jgi:hypothetical protein